MKVYISADIEGISGVVNSTQTSSAGHDYDRARRLMTEEVNAAIRGAAGAGADEILVNDSHGPMTNLMIENLDEAARLITGNQKPLGMMQGIDASYDAVVLVGYHARHNTSGVLAHTYNGRVVAEVCLNGVPMGEFEFNSLIAGHFDVPVVMVTGDDTLSAQVKAYNTAIETIVVKEAVSRYTANCLHPRRVHQAIEKSLKAILTQSPLPVSPCRLEGPVSLEVAFANSGMAENALLMPGTEMVAPNRVRYEAANVLEAYRVRSVLTILGSQQAV